MSAEIRGFPSGANVPTPPASGKVLTSTGSSPGDYDWEDGGGGSIPTSFLATGLQGPLAIGSHAQSIAWHSPADQLVGTDLSISEDGTTITIETTGFYTILLSMGAEQASDTDSNYALLIPWATSVDPNNWLCTYVVGPPGVNAQLLAASGSSQSGPQSQVTMPRVPFTAGDTLAVAESGTVVSGSAGWYLTNGDTFIIATRVP